MFKEIIIISLVLIHFFCFSQENELNFQEDNRVYALSVGISNYSNIHSLKYAHKDALSFSNYLLNNEFWKSKKINVVTLINENAKSGTIISEMSKIIDNSKEGDQVIFYFAGHGDIETVNNTGEAYLLTYDSPQNTYDAGGKISATTINDFFTALSNKGVFVYLIIDACRSGGLAGGNQGTVQTNLAFLKKSGNEIRILSSQYNQTSLEKASLEEGRGVFSYYLERGLVGFAESDSNNYVDLAELNMYLTKNVKIETDNKQIPKIEVDDATQYISMKNDSMMSNFSKPNSLELNKLSVRQRITNTVLAGSCSNFGMDLQLAINSKSAESSIILEQKYLALDSCLNGAKNPYKHEYTGLLTNQIYDFVLSTLNGEKELTYADYKNALYTCDLIFKMNQNKSFLLEKPLKNVQLYIETMMNIYLYYQTKSTKPIDSILQPLKNKLLEEISINANSTHLNYALSAIYSKENKLDSCILMLEQTVNKSPKWLNAKFNLALKYQEVGKIEESKKQLIEALSLDSTYKKFECFGCFFYVLEDIINGKENPYETEKEWNEILNLNLSKTEQFQVKFNLFINASEYLGTFKEIIAYRNLKKSITNNFSDKMLMLVADIQKEKIFLSDKKIIEFVKLLDKYSETGELELYINGNQVPRPNDLKSNDLFNTYFPEGVLISGYSDKNYKNYRSYIMNRLTVY